MVDGLSLQSTAYIAPATASSIAPQVVEFALPPPALALAQTGLVAATVIGQDANGALLLRTDFGTLALKTPLALQVGTPVELRLYPGSPATAALLSVNGAPLAFGGVRGGIVPPAGQGAVSIPVSTQGPAAGQNDPVASVTLGNSVRATVVTQGAGPNPPAIGSAMTLRVAVIVPGATDQAAVPNTPLPNTGAANAELTGTLIQTNGATTLVNTPLGVLTLDTSLDAAPGALLSLQRLDVPSTTGTQAPAKPASPTLASTWPSLDEALRTLDQSAPALAAQLRVALEPVAGPQLTGTLLFLMGVLQGNTAWPGANVGFALSAAGRDDLRLRLTKDVKDLRQLAEDTAHGEWRVYTLPVLDESAIRPLRLYLRQSKGDDPNANPDEKSQRFVVDLEMSKLGALQLDGMMRKGRFDLVLRSHQSLTPEMQTDIATIFHSSMDSAGLGGDISFATTRRFPVAPLDALRPHLGIQI